MKINHHRQREFFEYPFYILGLSLFPPLALYALNLGELSLSSLWRPLVFSFLFGLLVFAIIFVFKQKIKDAGLITVFTLLPVYLYGHVYLLFKNQTVFGILLGRHRVLFPIFMLGSVLLLWFVLKQGNKFSALHQILNIVFLTLMVFELVLIIPYEVKSAFNRQQGENAASTSDEREPENTSPDIYLIVLDSYMRSDWLKDSMGLENTGFLQELESLGFTIADCSRSNYSYTIQSMTSELSMNYLQDLDLQMNNLDLSAALKNSPVRKMLADEGYEFIFFETGYPWIEMKDADRFIESDVTAAWDAFELMFLETTMFKIPYDMYLRNNAELSTEDRLLQDRGEGIKSILTQLNPSLKNDAPMFVYAHIISPHSPYLFTSEGGINVDWELHPQDAARSTYQYLNKRMIEVLSEIVLNSENDPIIILQADHGNGDGRYRNLILNAYYLPGIGSDSLYSTITPVNTFRLVFNHYFGMDYPFLEDLGYYSPDNDRYNFELIEDPYDRCR